LLAEPDLTVLRTKSRYQGLFDLGVLSLQSINSVGPEFSELFKDGARSYCETADKLVLLKPEQRIEMRKMILKKTAEHNWNQVVEHKMK
jgi:hypothetical protein